MTRHNRPHCRALAAVAFSWVSAVYWMSPALAEPPPIVAFDPPAERFESLQLLSVTSPQKSAEARWLTYAQRLDSERAQTVLMLIDTSTPVHAEWSTVIPDAYEPDVQTVSGWTLGDEPLVAFRYRFGALAQTIDFYAIQHGGPVKLASLEAPVLEWKMSSAGQRLLVAYDNPHATWKPTCYRWQASAGRLAKASCKQ